MKRLLILGGSDLQVTLIKQAKSLGHYVITCDYLPDNPGHKYADEYYNVSTTDKEKVYELSKGLNLNGILAYASDPAAPTAAYVCEKLGLPTNPYDAVICLSRKDLFRDIMKSNGFLTPRASSFSSYENALNFLEKLNCKAIIKPVDSSGSKGVFELEPNQEFKELFETSIQFSKNKLVIIEEFIEKKGYQIGGDGFLVNGQLVFRCFGDIHFSKTNPLLPCAVSVPTLHPKHLVNKVHNEIQKLLTIAGMTMGGLNFDVLIDQEENVHILEIGPRNGGNLLPELIEYCTGVDMKLYAIKSALGEDCSRLKMTSEKSFYSHYVIHSSANGQLKSFTRSKKLEKHILFEYYNMSVGQTISKFNNSSNRLGMFLLSYANKAEMLNIIENMENHFKIEIENEA